MGLGYKLLMGLESEWLGLGISLRPMGLTEWPQTWRRLPNMPKINLGQVSPQSNKNPNFGGINTKSYRIWISPAISAHS